MATASAEVGTVFVDQFAATFQSPFDGVFQLIAVIVSSPLVAAGFRGAGPVRQFLRSGPGTHGPGELPLRAAPGRFPNPRFRTALSRQSPVCPENLARPNCI